MPVTRVEFEDNFINRHLYLVHRQNGDTPNAHQFELREHAARVADYRQGGRTAPAARLPTDVTSNAISSIGRNTPSTTMEFDELETRVLFEARVLDALGNSNLAYASGDHVQVTVYMPEITAISATRQQRATGGDVTLSGLYARVGGIIAGRGSDMALRVNHFEACSPQPMTLGVINAGQANVNGLGNLFS